MSENFEKLTIIEAIKYIRDYFGVPSKYALAKALSNDEVKVQPIQIYNYVEMGRKPSKKVAERFLDVYGIVITDVHDTGSLKGIE